MDITKEQINEHIKRLVTMVENEKITIIRCMNKFDKTFNTKYSNNVIRAKNKATKMLGQIERWKAVLIEKENKEVAK